MKSYIDILYDFLENGKVEGNFLVLKDKEYKNLSHVKCSSKIADYININIDKKKRYIVKTYYNGEITKKNPCIVRIDNNKVYFRCTRVFPTFFIDLLVLNDKFKTYDISIAKMFIGYHILAIESIIERKIENPAYYIIKNKWQTYFSRFSQKPFKMNMLEKYKNFLVKRGIEYETV